MAAELVPGYRIVHMIGQGGQAQVYLAERETDGLRVALKVLDSKLRHDRVFFERFLREYKLLTALENEFVVRIYDQGVTGDRAYIAMEFLPSGTLASRRYMSPEHFLGQRIDARSDLYSMGAILYEMLAGQRIYESETPASMIEMHVKGPVPRLPERLAGYQPIIDRLLAKKPDDRFQSARELFTSIAI